MSSKALNSWLVFVAFSTLGFAQAPGTSPAPSGTAEAGKEAGGYQVQQSIELGYRLTDLTGSQQMYNTLINQGQGPRILEQTLSMRSLTHTGMLFDSLSASSFGWGGDPENLARLQMSKNLWYDFSFSFRRDQNFFDYDLLANPLNPSTSSPNIPVGLSPHQMQTRRRMYDTDLTLMPQAKFSIRFAYSRNRSEGPSFSSFHEGTDALLNQGWNVTSNDFSFGFDFKFLPRTTISYDQAVQLDRNDTNDTLAPFASFLLADGTPVSLGLPINTSASQPCKTPLLATGFANPTCNLYIGYIRNQRIRTTTPTERLGFQSNYFKRLTMVGQASYSSADLNSPYFEFFNGLVSRSGDRQITVTGPVAARRIATTVDFSMNLSLTAALRLSDDFRYDNFHLPGHWNSTEVDVSGIPVGTPPAVNVLLSPLAPPTVTTAFTANFLGQKSFFNLMRFEYAPSRHAGVTVGFRFRHRRVFKAEPETVVDPEFGVPEFEGDTIEVNEYTPIFGAWLRPVDSLRINFEAEATAADNFITRISPRQRQDYRVRVNYKPRNWATIAGSAVMSQSRNGESDTQARQHYRNAGMLVSFLPQTRLGLDLGYNYTDALQNALICYNGSFNPPGTVVNGCPTFNSSTNSNPNSILSAYSNQTHAASATVRLQPVKQFTAIVGYGLTRSLGSETVLNPLQPFGPLQYTYHQPLASLSYEVVKNWSLNAYWNYDQYHEDSFTGPTIPRYFHDNRTTLSIRYAF